MANAGRKMLSGINTLVTVKSVKLDPNSKAYKKVIANSKGVLNGSPDIYQDTTKIMNTELARKLGYVKQKGGNQMKFNKTLLESYKKYVKRGY